MAQTSDLSKKGGFRYTLKQIRQNWGAYVFLLPFAICFCLFVLAPVLISIYYSFTYFNILEPAQFIGFENYINLFLNDDIFLTAVKNTAIIAVICGPLGYLMCFFFAWMINELNKWLRAIMVVVFYAPSLSGAAYTIFSLFFSGDSYGWLNSNLLNLGLINEPIQWLTDTTYMLWIIIIVQLWMSLGAGFLSFVAGFQVIDKSYYEAGYIDGIHNRWQELWFITLPAMKPQLMFGAVMTITSTFSVGDITIQLCGNPSTDYAAHTILNHLTDYGTTRFDMGYACAIATVLFLVMFLLNELIQRLLSHVGQ